MTTVVSRLYDQGRNRKPRCRPLRAQGFPESTIGHHQADAAAMTSARIGEAAAAAYAGR
jgi:hypothetical protein